jgi:hypothetical protein
MTQLINHFPTIYNTTNPINIVQKWFVDALEEVRNRARGQIGGILEGQQQEGGQPLPERSSGHVIQRHTTSHEIH